MLALFEDALLKWAVEQGSVIFVLVCVALALWRKLSKREEGDREDRTALVTALETSKAADIEARKAVESLQQEVRDARADIRNYMERQR